MPQLTPDQMILAGLGIMAAMGISFHPAAKEKALLIWEWIKNFGTSKKEEEWSPDDVISIEGLVLNQIDSPQEVHQVVTALAQYFQNEKDIKGVQLTARIGIHIYENQLSLMEKEQESNG